MQWLAIRNGVVLLPRLRSFALFLPSPTSYTSIPFIPIRMFKGQPEKVVCFTYRKVVRGSSKAAKKHKTQNNVLDDKNLSHILWWKERMEIFRKPSTIQLLRRLEYSNLLGLNTNLKNGSLKEGTLNWEMLQFKSRFPREVLLCRVGDFYEAIGIDACILVEYAGLNPFGGLRSDSIPRAGCPVVNLRQTLDDLTRNGFSVCIVEEVQGPAQARGRKDRFISGHAHPGNPYVYGLVGVDHDLDFPEPMPVVGISRSARGYCIVLVLETMKTYSLEDGLTEEAVVTKLRTCQYHHLFVHTSLRKNSSGTFRWSEYGEGGLLWGECSSKYFEWFDGNPVSEILFKVKELYGLDDEVIFRNTTVPLENRPRPLTLGTATQIGVIPTEGIPSLLKVILPSNCTGLPLLYVRDLLLNPPSYEIASTIQATCKLMSSVTCSIPEFTCVPSAKLVKLLESREANHIEFCRIKNVLDEILKMYRTIELNEILKLLTHPTWVATGLKIDFETLVNGCEVASSKIGEIISLDGEDDQKVSLFPVIPNDFFEDMEFSWKDRVKRVHIDDVFTEVEEAAEALNFAVAEDFSPIVFRIKASSSPLGGPKGEILYAREHEAVWFRGKRFTPIVWAGSPGEEQIKQLKPALDSKGKRAGEEWFTTVKVEAALIRYHQACAKARSKVLEILRDLSAELQSDINIIVFASMLLVIAKALFSHVSEGRRRKWVFPALAESYGFEDVKRLEENQGMKIVGLLPYWLNTAEGGAVHNTVDMQSLFLLTGPNGGGKSSLLRSLCAAALLGVCGLTVPAESALMPCFDSIMLHMKSYDSPADEKSSFQVEMSELRSIIAGTSKRSLVLVDEICRGTETAKGTCIAGSIIETLDQIGCLGIVSTHLHGIFTLPLNIKNTVYKAMGTVCIDGQTKPTWKLTDGICKESLAFETAKREGMPVSIIERAEELYLSHAKELLPGENCPKQEQYSFDITVNNSNGTHLNSRKCMTGTSHDRISLANQVEGLHKKVESAVTEICQEKVMELQRNKMISELTEIKCVLISAREQPPPSTVGSSSVYVIVRPDKKLYVGQTDDLEGRVRSHRLKEGLQNASFLYFLVPGKSLACELETLLINQLPSQGFQLANVADGKHRNFGTSNLHTECVVATS
ncbi:putative GIY-YIG nuclease superfamily, P-loop containing nucleoside triphosphate hydrolase [Lupinus albus]|uniref:Putative GIY-YIG nuclease superfamily, P-loop containing nucleoside triphosphate hydrolase n=1 Tax=Lupinus albus TaxID=3870 RepID=A0A6A4QZX7_LUPAL|nr:putative GIY-YIG nuclease superfamily, P-loop containing nucleoside triphosphate hydrolase [Lupinus albus]